MKTSSLLRSKIYTVISLLFWLILWEIIYRYVGREILVVSPFRAVTRLFEIANTPSFWAAVYSTCLKVLEGFAHSIWVGVALAVLTRKFVFLHYLFKPFLGIVRATPVASIIILALVWLTTSRIPVFVVFLMVMPIIWTNIFAGLTVVPIQLLEMGKIFKFNWWKNIRLIYIPSLMPYIVSALTTGLGVAWKIAIGAEVIARPAGTMGRNVYDARIHLLTADLFAWTIAIIVLSIVFEKAMVILLKWISFKVTASRS